MAEKDDEITEPIAASTVYLGTFGPDIEPSKEDDDRNLFNSHLRSGVILKEWDERARLIDINPMLSVEGRADAKAKALPEFLKKLEPLTQIADRHAVSITELESKITGFGELTVLGETRAGQLRDWFSRQPRGGAGGQVSIMREALETNNEELLQALCTANPALKLIDPKIKAAILAEMGERKYPKEMALIELKRKRQEVARFGLQRVAELMNKSAPRPKSASSSSIKPVWETSDAALRERFVVGDGSK